MLWSRLDHGVHVSISTRILNILGETVEAGDTVDIQEVQ